MPTSNDYVIGTRHWPIFGAIVQGFARSEYLMAIIVAALTKTDLLRTFTLMGDQGYSGKRNITRAIIDLSDLPPKQRNGSSGF